MELNVLVFLWGMNPNLETASAQSGNTIANSLTLKKYYLCVFCLWQSGLTLKSALVLSDTWVTDLKQKNVLIKELIKMIDGREGR